MENIVKIMKLSESRIKELIETKNHWYNGSDTYVKSVKGELDEIIEELKENNSVYLEDELGDLFWCYMCLLNSLEQEGKIDSKKVFERCYKKFTTRIQAVRKSKDLKNDTWNEIKQKQKTELEKEHNLKYNK